MNLDVYKIKKRIAKIAHETQCGHFASAQSCVELLCALYEGNPDRIVILSKGHGALAQYVILNELGKLPDRILDSYYKNGGLSGHATLNPQYGIYASTGSLGHGLPIGIGYAIADPSRDIFVVLSDGEIDEGSNHEAFRIINKLQLANIFVFIDYNGFAGFSSVDMESLPNGVRPYYSTKGKDMGGFENTLASHYTNLDKSTYELWLKNSFITEKNRKAAVLEYEDKLKKEKENDKRSNT